MTDNHISHYRDDASSRKAENENLPPVADLLKEINRLQTELKKQSELIDVLSTKSTVLPDEFMKFEVFCKIMGVTKREYKPLIASLQTDQDFYEVSERDRRLYGRTGVSHLFKIRELVAEKVKSATTNKKKAPRNDA